MKTIVKKSDLSEMLSKLASIIPVNPSQPALACVKLVADEGRLRATGTNLVMTVMTEGECNVEEEGCVVVNYKSISKIVSFAEDGDIVMATDSSGSLVLNTATGLAKLNTINKEFYPNETTCGMTTIGEIEYDALKSAIGSILFAVASEKEGRRASLTGVLVEKKGDELTFVGCNGKGLAVATKRLGTCACADDEFKFILPAKCAKWVMMCGGKHAEMFFSKEKGKVVILIDEMRIETQLVNDDYPMYAKVIPGDADNVSFEVQVDAFRSVVNRVSCASAHWNSIDYITIEVFDGKVSIYSSNEEVGSVHEKMEVKMLEGDKKGVKVFVDPALILNAVTASHHDEATVRIESHSKPIKITGGDDYIAVIMPIHLA